VLEAFLVCNIFSMCFRVATAMLKIFALHVWCCLSVTIVTLSSYETVFRDGSYRLPNNTSPRVYSINLVFGDFDRNEMTFSGTAYIAINVLEETNTIILHCSGLVNHTNLTKSTMNGVEVAHTYDIDTEKEFLIITTTEEILRKGSNVYLRVEYLGFISADEQIGVFRGEYQNADRRKRFKKNCFSLKKFIEKNL
jgi:Peptidase M1 N-terminal domain